MIKIIAIILQVVAVAGGVALGLSLRSPSETPEADSAVHESDVATDSSHAPDEEAKEEPEEKKKKKKKKKKKSDHGKPKGGHGGGEASEGDGSSIMKFSRQFIVPVVRSDGVGSLVALDINLELSPSATENVYLREPKLRDAILSALLKLSNEGAFNNHLLQPENMDDIRTDLYASAQSVLGDDVTGVLILNFARQDL